jgi:hypothetical protein
MADRSALRTARYRARLAGLPDLLAPQPCSSCGRLVRAGSRGADDGLCSRCWLLTTAGRDWNRKRCADWRQRRCNGM